MVADFPTVADHRATVAATANSLGRLLINLGPTRWAEAEKLLTAAVATAEKLADGATNATQHRVEVGNGLNNLGILATYRNQPAVAERWWLSALRERAKVAADSPANPWPRSEQADTHNNLGGLYVQTDRPAEGEEHLRAALQLREQLVADFPAVALFRSRLAYSCKNLGELAVERGERAAAESLFRRAFDLFDKLAAAFPAVAEYPVSLARTGGGYGRLLRRAGRPGEAVVVYDRAIDRLTAPAVRSGAADLRGALRADRASALAAAGKVEEAVAEVAELRKGAWWSAAQWYDFACAYAVAAGKLADKRVEYADATMEMLRQAVEVGYKNHAHMKTDADLDPLRGRDDFKKLLADLEAKFPPKREMLPAPRKE